MFKLTILFFALVSGQPAPIVRADVLTTFQSKEACEAAVPEAEKQLRPAAIAKAGDQKLLGYGSLCEPVEKAKGDSI